MDYIYKVSCDYKEEGLNYTVMSEEHYFEEFLDSAIDTFILNDELFNIEKKMLSLMTSKKVKVDSIDILVYESENYNRALVSNYRYVREYNGYKRLELINSNDSTLTCTHEEVIVSTTKKLIKNDFIEAKKIIINEIKSAIKNLKNNKEENKEVC